MFPGGGAPCCAGVVRGNSRRRQAGDAGVPAHSLRQEAMLKYGVDKPDLRNPLVLADRHPRSFAREERDLQRLQDRGEGTAAWSARSPRPARPRSRARSSTSSTTGRARRARRGSGYVVFEEVDGALVGKGPIAKFIPDEVQGLIAEAAGCKAGDAVFFSAGRQGQGRRARRQGAYAHRRGARAHRRRPVRLLLDHRLPDVRVGRGREEDRLFRTTPSRCRTTTWTSSSR